MEGSNSQTVVLGTVTQAEAAEIQALYKRKTALTELCLTLADRGVDETNDLYERLILDTASTMQKMVAWRERVAKTYGWPYSSDDQWRIDFLDRVVTLMRSDARSCECNSPPISINKPRGVNPNVPCE